MISINELQIDVNMGEITVSHNPATLACLGLGSCVALFLYDAERKVGGAAHVMLPDSSMMRLNITDKGGKFADKSPRVLYRRLINFGAEEDHIVAKLVGGADMFPLYKADLLSKLGERSVELIRSELIKMGIPIVGEATGGDKGRSAFLHLDSGKVIIRTAFGEEKEI